LNSVAFHCLAAFCAALPARVLVTELAGHLKKAAQVQLQKHWLWPWCWLQVLAIYTAAAAAAAFNATADAIDKILDINIKAALLLVQAAAPHMKRGGRIILISSVTAYQ
jgi:NAD(P)-dependent dehydrogenase (short-subunit alcohol dehydrogenase family)